MRMSRSMGSHWGQVIIMFVVYSVSGARRGILQSLIARSIAMATNRPGATPQQASSTVVPVYTISQVDGIGGSRKIP